LVLAVMLVAPEVTSVITALPTITDQLWRLAVRRVAVGHTSPTGALVAAGEMADRRGSGTAVRAVHRDAGDRARRGGDGAVDGLIVVGRALQGAGAGGFSPIAYMLVKRAFPQDRQAMMYAYLSAGWVLPSLFAPLLAGWVTDAFGWEWVFLGLVPFALAVGALAVRPMLRYGPLPFDRVGSKIPAAVVAAVGVGMLVTGLQFATRSSPSPPRSSAWHSPSRRCDVCFRQASSPRNAGCPRSSPVASSPRPRSSAPTASSRSPPTARTARARWCRAS
jgi:MFS family permease